MWQGDKAAWGRQGALLWSICVSQGPSQSGLCRVMLPLPALRQCSVKAALKPAGLVLRLPER